MGIELKRASTERIIFWWHLLFSFGISGIYVIHNDNPALSIAHMHGHISARFDRIFGSFKYVIGIELKRGSIGVIKKWASPLTQKRKWRLR